MSTELLPTYNCKVELPDGGIGFARETKPKQNPERLNVKVLKDGSFQWIELSKAQSGYSHNDFVVHKSPNGSSKSLGFGHILTIKKEFGTTKILVQFADSGEAKWLDWRTLSHADPVEARIKWRRVGKNSDHAERFRLRALAKNLELWNNNTGALGRIDVDPLPHQLDVAKRVVSAPQARWLLADDVGLGKTIEVGLILHALERRNRCRRVLIVCPASLTRQWQDEMQFKFERTFEIYKRDFNPRFSEAMRLRENVIVSMDLAKRPAHLSTLLQVDSWDVIIFDEAHRLGRAEDGTRTDRYRLAQALHERTASFLLLTATPHQGKRGRFAALLELVRPDLKSEIDMIDFEPGILKEIIIKNKKTVVTDAEGNLIFHGHDTNRVLVPKSSDMTNADQALTRYLRNGYRASDQAGSTTGRAIGFVMTTYRKLASSSVEAIKVSLQRRLEKLTSGENNSEIKFDIDDDIDTDTEGDDELWKKEILSDAPKFFDDEIDQLKSVIDLVNVARRSDTKLTTFLDKIFSPIINRGENLLIFTEYTATQSYLQQELQPRLKNKKPIVLINGSMEIDDRIQSVRRFNAGESQVLISTEAGGEGLNLQTSCHIMVNYDLPWNPSRLVQRIGRIYRYGQTKGVQVFNLHCDDSFDNNAILLMLTRVSTIAHQMSGVDSDNRKTLETDILGELLSNIDMEAILSRSKDLSSKRTEEEIEKAISAAKKATEDEAEFLQFSSSHDSKVAGGFERSHVVSFVEGMCKVIEVEVRKKMHGGDTLEIGLPKDMIGRWPEFGKKSIVQLCADPARAQSSSDLIPMDFECTFVKHLVLITQNRVNFNGLYAESPNQTVGDLVSLHQIRWQGVNGEMLEEELIPIALRNGTFDRLDHASLAKIMLEPWQSHPVSSPSKGDDRGREMAKGLRPAIDKILKKEETAQKSPSSIFTYAACRKSE